jgi:hypothetical protein
MTNSFKAKTFSFESDFTVTYSLTRSKTGLLLDELDSYERSFLLNFDMI